MEHLHVCTCELTRAYAFGGVCVSCVYVFVRIHDLKHALFFRSGCNTTPRLLLEEPECAWRVL